MQWWGKRKYLLVREKLRIDEKFPDNGFAFEIRGDYLWITGKILDFFNFECSYPQSYPSAPPDIFPKDRSSKWIPKHQYVKEGRFCLDIREKDWCSRLTAADIILSLQNLLAAEDIRKITKSEKLIVYEEPEPTIIDRLIRYKLAVLPSDLSFCEDQNYGQISYVYKFNLSTYRLIITEVYCEENKQESSIAEKIWLKGDPKAKFKGLWIRVNKDLYFELLCIKESQEVIKKISSCEGLPADLNLDEYFGKNSRWIFHILCNEYPGLPFLLDYNSTKKTFSRYGTYVFHIDKLDARIPSKTKFDSLKNKKVTIVGCGSGGSKDAEYLVKSGVGKIILIDDDTLQTENILRHSCTLDDLGIEKVYAVEDRLTKINPYVEIHSLRENLNIIDAKTDELIRDSDLIIVATAANEELFNEYAFSRNIPVIYSKVYPMGFGGEILRIIPGLTPCFECSHYFKESLLQENMPDAKFPEIQTTSYDILIDGTHVPVPALAVDSDFITLIGVKMSLEILVADDPKSLTESSHIRLWGNKKEWIFDQEYQSISIKNDNVKSFPNCIICYGDSVIEKELCIDQDYINNEYDDILSNIKVAK